MVGEQYYLFLIDKNGKKYSVFSKAVSLREIDVYTTKYNDKKGLIESSIAISEEDLDPRNFEEVIIYMKPNKNIEKYKKQRGPLFKEDAKVLCENATAGKLELLIMNKYFVKDFIKKYEKIPNFTSSIRTIEAIIDNNGDYMEELEVLLNKILSTYKGSRNAYLNMKSYDSKIKKEENQPLKEEFQTEIYHVRVPNENKKPTKNGNPKSLKKENSEALEVSEYERKHDILEYLKKYERELLDIGDFDHYKDDSPFDAHRTK